MYHKMDIVVFVLKIQIPLNVFCNFHGIILCYNRYFIPKPSKFLYIIIMNIYSCLDNNIQEIQCSVLLNYT